MKAYTQNAEAELAQKLRHVSKSPTSWWTIVCEAVKPDEQTRFNIHANLDSALHILEDSLTNNQSNESLDVYVCSNMSLIILGQGCSRVKIQQAENHLKRLFELESSKGEENFSTSFYDLSAKFIDFSKHFAMILAECEKLEEERESNRGILRQNVFKAPTEAELKMLTKERLTRSEPSFLIIEDDKSTTALLPPSKRYKPKIGFYECLQW